MSSANNAPDRIIPHVGKIGENGVKSTFNKEWRVFHENVSRQYFRDDSCHLFPKPAPLPSRNALALSRTADILTRKASGNDKIVSDVSKSHDKRNGVGVALESEGSDVIPDREFRQGAVPLSLQEHISAVLVDFNGADRDMSLHDVRKDSAACSGEQVERFEICHINDSLCFLKHRVHSNPIIESAKHAHSSYED